MTAYPRKSTQWPGLRFHLSRQSVFDYLRAHRVGLALFAAALLLYLPGIAWGLPYATAAERTHGWATDAITPLGPISELHNTLIQAKADRFLSYPLLHYFILASLYAPYLLYLWATGQFTAPAPAFPFGLADPYTSLQVFELLGKIVAVLMAAGVVVATYHIGKTLWGRTAGKLAGLFVLLLYPMFYYSRTGNLDVPVLFWASLGLWVFASILVEGFTVKQAVLLGAFAACTAGTKDQGGAAFILLPPFILIHEIYLARKGGVRLNWRPFIFGGLSFLLVYAVASGFVVNPERYFAHLAWVRKQSALPLQEHYPASILGYIGLVGNVFLNVVESAGPLILVAGFAGILLTWRREPIKLAMTLPALGCLVFVLMILRLSLMRYALPVTYVICLYAAYALSVGLETRNWIRWASGAAVGVILVTQIAAGIDLTIQMINPSQKAASAWLDEHTASGDVIGTPVAFASLPRLKAGIEYVLLPAGDQALAEIGQATPDVIIVMPDWTSPRGGLYPASFPEHAYQALVDGSLGYSRAAAFQSPRLIKRRLLDYPTVNPPIEIFVNEER